VRTKAEERKLLRRQPGEKNVKGVGDVKMGGLGEGEAVSTASHQNLHVKKKGGNFGEEKGKKEESQRLNTGGKDAPAPLYLEGAMYKFVGSRENGKGKETRGGGPFHHNKAHWKTGKSGPDRDAPNQYRYLSKKSLSIQS